MSLSSQRKKQPIVMMLMMILLENLTLCRMIWIFLSKGVKDLNFVLNAFRKLESEIFMFEFN